MVFCVCKLMWKTEWDNGGGRMERERRSGNDGEGEEEEEEDGLTC